jgi:anti-sigma factor RsiW
MSWFRRLPTPLPEDPSCEQVGAVLQAFVDGELGPHDTDLVAEHLEHCERCRIEATTVQQVVDTIRAQRVELGPEVQDRLTAILDELVPPTPPGEGQPEQHPEGG